MPVGCECAWIDEGLEDVVEQRNCGGFVGLCEEGLRAPNRKVPHEFQVTTGLTQRRPDNPLHHILVLEIFFRERSFSLLGFQLLELLIILIGLIEAISGIGHDHIEELLEERSFKVLLQVLSVALMRPQRSEDLIGVEPVLEFFVELVGSACDGDAAVKLYESVGQIPKSNPVISKDLMNQSSLVVMEEKEQQLHVIGSHIRVADHVLLGQQKADQV